MVQSGFKHEGDLIALLGSSHEDLATSEFAVTVCGVTTDDIAQSGIVPKLDLSVELAVQRACLEAAEAGLLQAAHDCSDGGLAVTLAESCFSNLGRNAIGARVDLRGDPGPQAWLFGESPSRIVISFAPELLSEVSAIASRTGAPFSLIGTVQGQRLKISIDEEERIDESVTALEDIWRTGLSIKLEAEAVAAGRE